MPYINVQLSKKVEYDEKIRIKAELGRLIEVFPGKSENWLMCQIESEKDIWFKGIDSEPSAFIEVKLFGSVNKECADKFTSLFSTYLEADFGIAAERIYIRYEGGSDWGWNGSNF